MEPTMIPGMDADRWAAAITEGVRQAFAELLDREELLDAVTEGARLALDLVFAGDIANAIADGTRDALRVGSE